MNKPTPQQLKKLERVRKISKLGNLGIAEEILYIHDEIDGIKESMPTLEKVIQNVRGKDGTDGEPGYQGEPGVRGPQGEPGKDGKDGIAGPKGDTGESITGPSGADGATGLNGKDGIDGIPGKDGSPDDANQIASKLNTLDGAVDSRVIKGFDDLKMNVTENLARLSKGFNPAMGPSFADLQNLSKRIAILEAENGSGSGVGAWTTPPESPASDGSVVTFTVGSSAPTDVVSDGTLYFNGAGYTFSAGHITLINGPTQYIRYR